MIRQSLVMLIVSIALAAQAAAHMGEGEATYLGNEGVLVSDGETKVLFDPLYPNGFGTYRLVPEEMRADLMAGRAPFDGVDVVFISHFHADHFSASETVAYLRARPDVRLVAPEQAVVLMREAAGDDAGVFDRVSALDLSVGDAPARFDFGEIGVEAVAIPHAGGARHAGVSNLVYRVALSDAAVVMHLGDATTDEASFDAQAVHWAAMRTHTAFPPYWFFGSEAGRRIVDEKLNADHAVGVHVPIDVPDLLIQGARDYFSEPGETRPLGAPPSVQDEIRARLDAFEAAGNAGDIAALKNFYANIEGFQWLEDGRVAYPSHAAIAAALDQAGRFQSSIALSGVDVVDLGDGRAYAAFAFDQTLTPPNGDAIVYKGRITALMAKGEDGVWRAVRGHTSTERPQDAR